jgi:suppressor for copper-sensitivity B
MDRPGALCAVLLALCVVASDAAPGRAAAGAWSESEQGRVRLVSAGDTVGSGPQVRAGLQFEMQPGWKIYWRNPGDAGYPPQLDWTRSDNLAAADIQWPVPHRFALFGLQTFGYEDEVVLPIMLRVEDPARPLSLRADLNYLTCEEVCVPVRTALALDLPAGDDLPSRHGFLIEQYAARVPGKDASHGMTIERATLAGPDDAPRLEVAVRSELPWQGPDLLVEAPAGFLFGPPEVRTDAPSGGALLVSAVDRTAAAEGDLAGRELTLTVTDGLRGVERTVQIAYADADDIAVAPREPVGAAPASLGLLAVLGLALLGGLILNLMPCVLPVLSLKLLAVVGHGGGDRRPVRVGFLASAAGIVVSFLGLAAVAIALRSAGLAAGWGIQFQQPLFLVAMLLVLTLFACNLWGWFEIPLPRWAGGLGAIGQSHGNGGHSVGGHFLTGVFATLLATPCSAPFLGTAVGFALARGPAEILLIFAALGLGLALPYLVVAAVPALATRLPKPGHWMITLRRVLGLALAMTAVWLLTVLARQQGWPVAALAAAVLLAIAGVLALRPGRLVGAAAVTGLALILVAAPFVSERGPERAMEADWAVLDRARIADEVASGRVVFIDVTADWCITCQVNKRLVLDRDDVRARLEAADVLRMRGDWTRPDDTIASYLAAHGRYGIPFNAVYGPGAPDGIVLPELLSTGSVLDALEQARGG